MGVCICLVFRSHGGGGGGGGGELDSLFVPTPVEFAISMEKMSGVAGSHISACN